MEGATPSSAGAKRKLEKTDKKEIKKTSKPEIKDSKDPSIPSPLPGFNLAGRPASLKKADNGGIKRTERKSSMPSRSNDINTEPEWTFIIKSNRQEWIRFFPNSISCQIYGTRTNPDYVAGDADAQKATEKHALLAHGGAPQMFVDPVIMGTGFVKAVRVQINGVPVPSTQYIDPYFLHYVRCSRLYNKNSKNYFAVNTDVDFTPGRNSLSESMRQATLPFDYITYNSTFGRRVPIFMDGIFPFDFKNKTLESLDGKPEPTLYLPPESTIIITLVLHKDKIESIFHDGTSDLATYFNDGNAERPANSMALTFQNVLLEYESAELTASEHVKAMNQYQSKEGVGIYDYDIPRGQHQSLLADQSYTENNFQILPQCRLVYVMFLPSWSTFVMDTKRKPLSGFSKFPTYCSDMNISFAGESNLITANLERLGYINETHQISKKMLFEYYKENKFFSGTFEQLFPPGDDVYSIVQSLILDLGHLESQKTEVLTLKMRFGAAKSQKDIQIVCLSVHTNGRAVCRSAGAQYEWDWKFNQVF